MPLNLQISKRGISATSADRIDRGGDRRINRAALARSQRWHEPAGKKLYWSWSYEASLERPAAT